VLLLLALAPAAESAIRQDGTDTQHLAGPNVSSPDLTDNGGDVTLMQWHKLNVDHNAIKILFQYHNNGDGGTFHSILFAVSADGTTADFITAIDGVPSQSATAIQSISVGAWYYYVITRSGTSIKFYIGSETTPVSIVATLTDAALQAQSSAWRWTATGNSTATLSADASIERFKLYSRELTLGDIDTERATLPPVSEANLWTYNPFAADGDLGAGTPSGSDPWIFSEQGASNFSTVAGPAPTPALLPGIPINVNVTSLGLGLMAIILTTPGRIRR